MSVADDVEGQVVILRCDVTKETGSPCEFTIDSFGRGFQRMGLHRFHDHGLKGGTAPPPTRISAEGTETRPEPASVPSNRASSTETPPAAAAPPETAPRRGKTGFLDRFRGRGKKEPRSTGPERAPKKSASHKRRVPLDTDISDAWAFLGRRLEQSPHYPTGRMLTYQAPGAGIILDKALAGTAPDRLVLQPLARNRDKYEDAFFLCAGPLVTFGITRSFQALMVAQEAGDAEQVAAIEARIAMQLEGLDWLLRMMLPRLAEGKKRAEEKRAAEEKVIAEAFPELAGTGESPSRALRDMLFAPPPTYQGAAANGNADSTTANGAGPDTMAQRAGPPDGPS
jgi:hypothetical protein